MNLIKMRSAKYLFVMLTAIVLAQSGCKKGESAKTKTEYLIQKPWILEGYRINVGEVNENWVKGNVTACNIDDIYTFKTDYNFAINEGTVTCSSNGPTEQKSLWSVLVKDQTIKIDGTYFSGSYAFKQIDDYKLVLLRTNSILKEEFTFIHP